LRIVLIAACLLGGCAMSVGDQAPGLNVGRAALDSGSPDVALHVSQDALRRAPNDIPALILQGDALTAQGQTASAEASYRRVLALDAGNSAARLGLGRLALDSNPPAAELMFLEVLAREPRNAIALNDLGIARDLQDHHEQAQAAYRQALGVAPDMQAAVVNLALSLALSGQADRARDLLRPLAAAPDVSPRVRHDYALVSEIAGDHAAAETTLKNDLSADDLRTALKSFDALSEDAKAK
jgi:Flp pilus assembly protein TadD